MLLAADGQGTCYWSRVEPLAMSVCMGLMHLALSIIHSDQITTGYIPTIFIIVKM